MSGSSWEGNPEWRNRFLGGQPQPKQSTPPGYEEVLGFLAQTEDGRMANAIMRVGERVRDVIAAGWSMRAQMIEDGWSESSADQVSCEYILSVVSHMRRFPG